MLVKTANARMNPAVVELHAEDAAFLAAQRRRAMDGPRYQLIDLYDLEDRLSGHLGALFRSDEYEAEAAVSSQEELDYGTVFVAACSAFHRSDRLEISHLIALGGNSEVTEALSAAAAWCAPTVVAEHPVHVNIVAAGDL